LKIRFDLRALVIGQRAVVDKDLRDVSIE